MIVRVKTPGGPLRRKKKTQGLTIPHSICHGELGIDGPSPNRCSGTSSRVPPTLTRWLRGQDATVILDPGSIPKRNGLKKAAGFGVFT